MLEELLAEDAGLATMFAGVAQARVDMPSGWWELRGTARAEALQDDDSGSALISRRSNGCKMALSGEGGAASARVGELWAAGAP